MDACEIVESGMAKIDHSSAAAPPPALIAFAWLCSLQALALHKAEALTPASYDAAHPDQWVPIRHLTTRAVAPARAPARA